MVKDDQDSVPATNPRRGRVLTLGATALVLVGGALLGTGLACRLLHAQAHFDDVVPKRTPPPKLFREWPADRKPDVVLLLTGQQNGYIMPCGCSRPQLGGLERRYNILAKLRKEKGWTVVPIDLGNVPQTSGPQATLKYVYSMRALKAMNYAAVGIGLNEMSLGLLDVLGRYTLNNPTPPVVFSNLLNAADFANLTSTQVVAPAGKLKIGILSVVARGAKAKALPDPSVKAEQAIKAINKLLPALRASAPDLLILLFHGSADQAKECARRFPQFQVVLASTEEEEPPGTPTMVGNTRIINMGHKGRYVGLLGVYHTNAAKRFELHYQLAAMTEDYETPAGQDARNPVLGLLEQYTREVKDNHYLDQYIKTRHPIQIAFPGATYVGSEKCKSCHHEAYKIWKNSPHSHAFASLETAKRPSLRQYDGECVKCHVVGFEYMSGYANESKTPILKDNGCENCHGPCSIHADKKNPERVRLDPKLLHMMNPFKTPANETAAAKKIRLSNLDTSCQKCHDIDNDVHWDFEKKWPKIAH